MPLRFTINGHTVERSVTQIASRPDRASARLPCRSESQLCVPARAAAAPRGVSLTARPGRCRQLGRGRPSPSRRITHGLGRPAAAGRPAGADGRSPALDWARGIQVAPGWPEARAGFRRPIRARAPEPGSPSAGHHDIPKFAPPAPPTR